METLFLVVEIAAWSLWALWNASGCCDAVETLFVAVEIDGDVLAEQSDGLESRCDGLDSPNVAWAPAELVVAVVVADGLPGALVVVGWRR